MNYFVLFDQLNCIFFHTFFRFGFVKLSLLKYLAPLKEISTRVNPDEHLQMKLVNIPSESSLF